MSPVVLDSIRFLTDFHENIDISLFLLSYQYVYTSLTLQSINYLFMFLSSADFEVYTKFVCILDTQYLVQVLLCIVII